MDRRDYIGKRGEDVFAFLIGRLCRGRFWFVADFRGDKAETSDFTVRLIRPPVADAKFVVQVKATTQGYRGTGVNRKLAVQVSKDEVIKLKLTSSPAYVVGVDAVREKAYIVPITSRTPDLSISGISCRHPLGCNVYPALWKDVVTYWSSRDMSRQDSLLS